MKPRKCSTGEINTYSGKLKSSLGIQLNNDILNNTRSEKYLVDLTKIIKSSNRSSSVKGFKIETLENNSRSFNLDSIIKIPNSTRRQQYRITIEDCKENDDRSNSISEYSGILENSRLEQAENQAESNNSKAMSSWRVVLNVIKAIKNMKTIAAHEINTIDDLDIEIRNFHSQKERLTKFKTMKTPKLNLIEINKESKQLDGIDEIAEIAEIQTVRDRLPNGMIEQSPIQNNIENANRDSQHKPTSASHRLKRHLYSSGMRQNTFDAILDIVSKQNLYSKFVSQGDDRHMDDLRLMLMKDPMRNIFGSCDREKYFINQPTHDNMTYLYLACMNGHINYIELLLKCDADPLIKCGKPGSQLSILDAAVKWSHVKVVSYLVETNEMRIEWPYEYIVSALRLANNIGNKNIIRILKAAKSKARSQKSTGCFACFA